MEAQTPNKDHIDVLDVCMTILNFILKHILGLLSIMFGVVAKVYIVRKEYKRITKWQCRLSVFFSGLSGTITYMALVNVNMVDWKKAFIVGFMPIIVEPIMTRMLIWINPIIDEIGNFIKSYFKSKSKEQ